MELHTRARLGLNDDQRRNSLLVDPRLEKLQLLAGIELMPITQLTNVREMLTNQQSCFALTERDLEASPTCPHCGFRPQARSTSSSSEMLTQIDRQLDELLVSWTGALLSNLEDPVTKRKLDLLSSENAENVKAFIAAKSLPDPLDPDFVQALDEAFSDLVRVPASLNELDDKLFGDHGAMTVDELRARFESWLDNLVRGKDPRKARIVFEARGRDSGETRGDKA